MPFRANGPRAVLASVTLLATAPLIGGCSGNGQSISGIDHDGGSGADSSTPSTSGGMGDDAGHGPSDASIGANGDGAGAGDGASAAQNDGGDGGASGPAVVRMLHRVSSDDDAYITTANSGNSAARAWLGTHWPLFEGFSGGPTGAATLWTKGALTGGLLYWDTTAVNTASNPPSQYILKRKSTTTDCYNPYGGNPNPQVTWDVTSETTRQYLIGQMKQAFAQASWKGFWLDDVNLDIGSSCVGPDDETWYTEFGDTWADTWANAVVTFVEEIRAAFPDQTLLENAPWFSRGTARWTDPYVVRQLKTVSLANREGGVLDDGLTTGTGYWSVNSLFDYVDAVHATGAGMVWDSFPSTPTEQEYALAAYFIGYTDQDFYGDVPARQPSSWPALYDIDLGRPLGARTFDGTARFTRVFEKGTVVLDVNAKTGSLPGF